MNRQNHRAPRFSVWLLGTCFFIVCFQLSISLIANPGTILGMLKGAQTPVVTEETIKLPVNADQPVSTSYQYTGYVTITIRGIGQIDANTRHDAFRQFTNGGKTEYFNGFIIDGESQMSRVFTNPPSPTNKSENEYKFLYYVGTKPRSITFNMVNGNRQDTSEFIVEVSDRNAVGSSGR